MLDLNQYLLRIATSENLQSWNQTIQSPNANNQVNVFTADMDPQTKKWYYLLVALFV